MSAATQLTFWPLVAAPADVLPPRLAARIAVLPGGHWVLKPAPDGRGNGTIGARNSKGYAQIAVPGRRGKNQLLTRFVLTCAVRPPLPGEQACHNDARCDVRACCAPACLYWGSPADNARDATRKRLARKEPRS